MEGKPHSADFLAASPSSPAIGCNPKGPHWEFICPSQTHLCDTQLWWARRKKEQYSVVGVSYVTMDEAVRAKHHRGLGTWGRCPQFMCRVIVQTDLCNAIY